MTKVGIFVHIGLDRSCRLIWCPIGELVGGCGVRAVSRKTPIYFIELITIQTKQVALLSIRKLAQMKLKEDKSGQNNQGRVCKCIE